jgi:hypothetical protein
VGAYSEFAPQKKCISYLISSGLKIIFKSD